MRPVDPGSVLSAGFLKELGRSHCISFKNNSRALACFSGELVFTAAWWLCCVVLCSGAPLGFLGCPHSALLGDLIPTSPPRCSGHSPCSRHLLGGLSSCQEPGAMMAGGVQGIGKVQACALRSRLRSGVYPLFAHGGALGRI